MKKLTAFLLSLTLFFTLFSLTSVGAAAYGATSGYTGDCEWRLIDTLLPTLLE